MIYKITLSGLFFHVKYSVLVIVLNNMYDKINMLKQSQSREVAFRMKGENRLKKFIKLVKGLIVMSVSLMVLSSTAHAAVHAQEEDVPEITLGWNKDLHSGIFQLAFEVPEEFENNDTFLRPVGPTRFELVKDGEVIAVVNHILTKGGSESVTMMAQGQLDIGGSSSTAYLQAYDTGNEIQILSPLQNGGISFVAQEDAPYNNFAEFVEHAKSNELPIMAGYHSAISAPRVIMEYAMLDEGLSVAHDTADIEADVVLVDLKGQANLVPSLSSNQVELITAPEPYPQHAVNQGVGKVLDDLNTLQDGVWTDFPCCTLNASKEIIENHPEVVQAVMDVTTDLSQYATENRAETAAALSEYLGLEVEILEANYTVYATAVTEQFTKGIELYVEFLNELGNFEGRLSGLSFEEVEEEVFDYTFSESSNAE